jgi:Protein of unknown function (DUF2852)
MTAVVKNLDDLGKPAWIAAMILGFILFWPLGLALLAYIIWSGRMSCTSYGPWGENRRERWERKMAKWQGKMNAYSSGSNRGFAPTGNRAFDEYRDSMLKRLEDEASEFQDFLARLRMARDKQEFDQYMSDRQKRGENGQGGEPANPPPAPPNQ